MLRILDHKSNKWEISTVLLIIFIAFAYNFLFIDTLQSSLTDDTEVEFVTDFGQSPFGTTGNPNLPGGLSDTSAATNLKATLTVDSATKYRITMDTAIGSGILFAIEGVDWGSGGIIDTVSIVPQTNVEVAQKTNTTLKIRTKAAFAVGESFFIDVTGVHVPEPKTYATLAGVLVCVCILSRYRLLRKTS